MKLGRLIVIAVVIYVGYKYVWPMVAGGGAKKQQGKAAAGRTMG